MTQRSSTTDLPVLHRLTIVYLMLPVVLWLVGWFRWWVGIPATALLVVGLWKAMRGSWRVSPRPVTFALLLLALGWVMTTAAGGVFDFSNGDWIKHRAILTDLAQYAWPVHLPDPLAAFLSAEARTRPDSLLRYYLGYYLTPGLIGHWFGLAALNWAVPLWTWCGVALLMLLFTRRFSECRAALVAAVILMSFSGMDFLRIVLLFGDMVPLFSGSHIESDDSLMYTAQYSSNTTALMWVPQHFIAGGLYTMLLIQLRRQPQFLAVSGILLAASLFWSPFVAVGLLPLVAVLLRDNGIRPFLLWQNLLLAGPLAGLLVAYLTSDSSEIPKGWLWHKADWADLVEWLPVFYLTEFLVLVLLLWLLRPQVRREPFFLASVATLLILPLYTYGVFNDLSMRASLPALMILCWYCAEAVSKNLPSRLRFLRWRTAPNRVTHGKRPAAKNPVKKRPEQTSETGARKNRTHVILVCLMVTLLVVGAVTPLHELVRAYESFGMFRYQHILFSISTNTPRPAWTQYVADDVPSVLRGTLRENEDAGSVEGQWNPVIRSDFDVYRNRRLLIYTKASCTEKDVDPLFFLNVWPLHASDLPDHRKQRGFDSFVYADVRIYMLWMGERCAMIRRLPEYEIKRVVTGQLDSRNPGKRIWRGEFSGP